MVYSDINDAKEESIIDTLEWCFKHSKKEIKDRLKEYKNKESIPDVDGDILPKDR